MAFTYAGHDEFSNSKREVKVGRVVYDKGPFKPVKSFFQVNLEDHVDLFALHGFEVIYVLLDNDSIVSSSSFREETAMGVTDEVRYAIDNNFSGEFVGGVT